MLNKMRIPGMNTTRTSQFAEHDIQLANAFDRHEREYADRHGDDPIHQLRARLYTMGPDIPAAPKRAIGSRQHVLVFRTVTMKDMIPPDVCGLDPAEILDEAGEKILTRSDSYRHTFELVTRGEGHAALVGFQTASAEKAAIDHDIKLAERWKKLGRRAERMGRPKVEQDLAHVDEIEAQQRLEKAKQKLEEAERRSEAAARWSEANRSLKQEVQDLFKHGFFFKGGMAAGDDYDAFAEFFGEDCLRSHLGSPSIARWVQILPRANRLRIGMDKEALFSTASKALGLLAPYVEMDRKRACAIVVELDTVWTNASGLRARLLEILPPHMLPNLIVGRYGRDHLFCRPHCIWLLKPGSEIWMDLYTQWTDENGKVRHSGDKRCRKQPVRFFHAIQRALTALLLPVGADPACHNIWKPKNPVSPFWTTVVANDDYWPTLKDFLEIPKFRLGVDEHAISEEAAAMRAEAAGSTRPASNLLWCMVGNLLEPLVRQAFAISDPSFMEAIKNLDTAAAWLEQRVRAPVESEVGGSDALDLVLARRCAFAARYCQTKRRKPRKATKRRMLNRGRDRDLAAKADPKQRRALAGQRSAKHRRAKSILRLRQEMIVALRATGAIRKSEFIKTVCMVSKSVVYEIFDEAIAALAVEFRDGSYLYRYIGSARPGKVTNSSAAAAASQESVSVVSTQLSKENRNVRSPVKSVEHHSAGPPLQRLHLSSRVMLKRDILERSVNDGCCRPDGEKHSVSPAAVEDGVVRVADLPRGAA
jgi:hypothetical protein